MGEATAGVVAAVKSGASMAEESSMTLSFGSCNTEVNAQ